MELRAGRCVTVIAVFSLLFFTLGCELGNKINVTLTVDGNGRIIDMTSGLQVGDSATLSTTVGSEHIMSAGCTVENVFEGWYLNDAFVGGNPLQSITFNNDADILVARFGGRTPTNETDECLAYQNSTPLVIYIGGGTSAKYQCDISPCSGTDCESSGCELCTVTGACISGCEAIPDNCYADALYYRATVEMMQQGIYTCNNGYTLMVLE